MQCGAEDHFSAWVALGGAVIAAVIALAGVGFAGLLENHREAARRQHEKETRFHDDRLHAYIEFMGAAATLFATVELWLQSGGTLVQGSLMQFASQSLEPYTVSVARVTMLASKPVRDKLTGVHNLVDQLTILNMPMDRVQQIVDDSIHARIAFDAAARRELGIE